MPALVAGSNSSTVQDEASASPLKVRKRSAAAATSKGRPKPYACTHPGCGLAFHAPARLAEHTRRHTGEVSPGGYARFCIFDRGTLLTQQLSCPEQRPFVCAQPECGASFTRSHHLTVHARVHADAPAQHNVARSGSSRAPTGRTAPREVHVSQDAGAASTIAPTNCSDGPLPRCAKTVTTNSPSTFGNSDRKPDPLQRRYFCSAPSCCAALWTQQHLDRHEASCDAVRSLRLGGAHDHGQTSRGGMDATSTEGESDAEMSREAASGRTPGVDSGATAPQLQLLNADLSHHPEPEHAAGASGLAPTTRSKGAERRWLVSTVRERSEQPLQA